MTRPFKTDVNRLIFESLFQKEDPIPFNKLYGAVQYKRKKEKSGGKLSLTTFQSRLCQLNHDGIVAKTDGGFSLTEKAHFLHGLKILNFGRSDKTFLEQTETELKERAEIDERAKVYLMLSFYGSGWRSYSGIGTFTRETLGFRRLNNETEFNDFLSKYNLTKEDLKIIQNYSVKSGRNFKRIREFLPDPVNGIKIRMLEEGSSTSYEYALPGFTISEILRDTHQAEFSRFPINRSKIQKAIDLMLAWDIMESAGTFEGEMRYKLKNPRKSDRIRRTITERWELYEEILHVICEVYKKGRKEEKRWLGFFYGSEPNGPLEQWLQELRHNRHQVRRKNQRVKPEDFEKLTSSILEKFERIIESLNPTEPIRFFVEMILEYIYPHFMRNASYH